MLNRTFFPFPVLTTERLTLRRPVVGDAEGIFVLRSDAEINKYLDRDVSNTIDDAWHFIDKINGTIDKNAGLYWVIRLTDRNLLAGTICLFNFSDEKDSCEIGYELLTDFQGQGIMREAMAKVIEYAIYTIHVQKIEAFSHRDNKRSIKLLEKFSFIDVHEPDHVNPEFICFHLINSSDKID